MENPELQSQHVAALRTVRGRDTSITVSIGVARLNAKEDTGGFVERADKALFAAKRNGRNRSLLG